MKVINCLMHEPQLIIGIENCERCKVFKHAFPSLPYYEIPDKLYGFGDVIARIAYFFNIKKCARCKIRHYKYNKWLPFFWTNKGDRKLRLKLIEIDATIFPVVTDFEFKRKYNLDNFVKDFTKFYPDPE